MHKEEKSKFEQEHDIYSKEHSDRAKKTEAKTFSVTKAVLISLACVFVLLGINKLSQSVDTGEETNEGNIVIKEDASSSADTSDAESDEPTVVKEYDDGVKLMSNGELIGTDSPDITGPTYGFEYEDFDKLMDAGINLPALYQLKVKLSNYLTNNGLDPYSAGTVNYVDGSFSGDDETQSFLITISGYPDLSVRCVYTISTRTVSYEDVSGASANTENVMEQNNEQNG